MQLSKNFTLEEFTLSNTAVRYGYEEQFTPSAEVINNLRLLIINLIQPVRDEFTEGFIRVSSGYRCERLNKKVKGSKTSQHLVGQAADLQYIVHGVMDNQKIINTVKRLGLDYDQMIAEFPDKETGMPSWVHLSYNEGHNRKQFFSIT
jgi:hypothetical protein